MSSKSVIQHALNKLSKQLKLESLTLNEKNECYLMFDGEYHVRCSYVEKTDECILYSIIGRVPKYSLNAYTKILSDNFFWVGTAGSTLCLEKLDKEDDELVLYDRIPVSILDDQILYDHCEDFVNAIEYWTEQYPKLNMESQEATTVNSTPRNNRESKIKNKVLPCNIM